MEAGGLFMVAVIIKVCEAHSVCKAWSGLGAYSPRTFFEK